MKAGDLVRFKGLQGWGEYGLITEVRTKGQVFCQVHVLIRSGHATIPHWKKDEYMEVISESR
tara:strand:+ start:1584 stop:1769 length:186 start_codon:yes stop_codon:yes gene_type:complete